MIEVGPAMRDIAQGLVSVTYDTRQRSMTFVYEAGSPIMVNECVAWTEEVDEVVIFDGARMAHRYRQTSPDMWDDELTASGRACSLAPHSAQPRGAAVKSNHRRPFHLARGPCSKSRSTI